MTRPSPPVVDDGRQSEGVPASPSGYSAEPEPSSTVSAVPVSIPNAHEERLRELAALERGWNGYHSDPIRPYVLDRVRPLISLAEELGLQPWVTPLSNGGLQLERAGEDDWSLEVNPDGSFNFYASISCTWRAAPNAAETAEEFLKFASAHFRSSLSLASAIEARRDATTGAVHESATGEAGDAQPGDSQ